MTFLCNRGVRKRTLRLVVIIMEIMYNIVNRRGVVFALIINYPQR